MKRSACALAALLLLLPFALGSCGEGKSGAGGAETVDELLQESRRQAWKAVEEAELLLQGAEPGTDLSDARELLDQARALYESARTSEELTGDGESVLTLVEEAKRRARQAMEARLKQ